MIHHTAAYGAFESCLLLLNAISFPAYVINTPPILVPSSRLHVVSPLIHLRLESFSCILSCESAK